MIQLHTIEELQTACDQNDALFVLKHSTTCPISLAAYDEYEAFTKEQQEVPTYFLTVQDARPLSNYIAETFDIKHESPQAILFSKNKPVWNASHRKITVASLTDSLTVK